MSDLANMTSDDLVKLWAENLFGKNDEQKYKDRLERMRERQDPDHIADNPDLDFDIMLDHEHDLTKLEEVGIRILENAASNEDYQLVRDMAAKYMPGQMFKFSPRLMGRDVSLESLDGLKQYAGAGIAVAVVLALLSLIDHLFGGGGDSGKGGSVGKEGTKSDVKRFKEAKEKCDKAMERLSRAEQIKPLAQPISRLTSASVEEMMGAADDPDKLHKTKGYRDLAQVIERQTGLTGKPLDTAVLATVRIARKYAALMGVGDDYTKLREHFSQGLDLHKTLNTEVFTASRNQWCRMAFLSTNGFTPSNELATVHKALVGSVELFSEYRTDIDQLVNSIEGKSNFDRTKFIAKASNALEAYGIDPGQAALTDTAVSIAPTKVPLSAEESKVLNDAMKAHFELLDPNKIVAKNVLSKLIGHDQAKLISELESFDEIVDASSTLKSWIEKSEGNGSLVELLRRLDELKKQEAGKSISESAIPSINLAIRLVQTMMRASGNLITAAGNFKRGINRVSVDFVNFSTKFLEISEMVEKLEKVNRSASNESILEDKTGDLPVNPEDEPNNNNEVGLHMREIHIPKGVILPHGLDVPALRDLVEEDPSDWTQAELGEYIEGSNNSLESLGRDLAVIEDVMGRIKRTGMISRRDVTTLEEIHPGLITNQTPIGRFTSFESVNYARPSLENAAKLAGGAQAVAAVAAVAILAKILQWCYKRFQASRDVTKSIKGTVDVLTKVNDQTISIITGSNDRVAALNPDAQGRLNVEAKKYYSEKNLSNDWYNIQDVEKSLMTLRERVFAKQHVDSYSELMDSMVKGEDAYKLVQALTQAAEKGATVLDKAVDNAAHQIDQLKSSGGNGNTESTFKGLDYGLDSFRIKDLDLSKAQGNIGRAELITSYVEKRKEIKLGKEGIGRVEVDKMMARLTELSEKLKEVNGRVDSDFKKIQGRLEKLEKSNAASSEKDDSEGSQAANRDAIKAYIDSIQAEFNAYSKVVGAHKAILTLVDAEIKKYGTTLKEWNKLVNWHSKQIASAAKEKAE